RRGERLDGDTEPEDRRRRWHRKGRTHRQLVGPRGAGWRYDRRKPDGAIRDGQLRRGRHWALPRRWLVARRRYHRARTEHLSGHDRVHWLPRWLAGSDRGRHGDPADHCTQESVDVDALRDGRGLPERDHPHLGER